MQNEIENICKKHHENENVSTSQHFSLVTGKIMKQIIRRREYQMKMI